jgi:MATH domain/Ring finger domain/TRAF-type zinc finger
MSHKLGGFNVDHFAGDVDSDFLCSICQDVMRNPVEAYNTNDDEQDEPCCHLFCKSCIEKWLESKSSCPQCRKHLKVEHLHKAVRLQRKIWDLAVCCRNRVVTSPSDGKQVVHGCPVTGSLGREGNWWQLHERSGCEYIRQVCPFCGDKVFKKELEEHKSSACAMRPVSCQHCKRSVSANRVQAHIERDCQQVLIKCPNECTWTEIENESEVEAKSDGSTTQNDDPHCSGGSVVELPRCMMKSHIQLECPRAVVPCGYVAMGCKAEMPRSKLAQHLADKSLSHMQMAASSVSHVIAEMEAVKSAVVSLQRQNAALRRHVGLPDVKQTFVPPMSASLSSRGSVGGSTHPTGAASTALNVIASSSSQQLTFVDRSDSKSSKRTLGRSLTGIADGAPYPNANIDTNANANANANADVESGSGMGQQALDVPDDVGDLMPLNPFLDMKRLDAVEEMLHVPGRIEWTVHNWSQEPENTRIYSPMLLRNGKKWRGTVEKKSDGSVSMFLRYEDGPRPLYVRLTLMVVSSETSDVPVVTSSLTHTYQDAKNGGFQGWGCNRFTTIEHLIRKGGYNPTQDSITFLIEFVIDNKRLKLEQDMAVVYRRLDELEKRGDIPACMEWTINHWEALPSNVSSFSPVIFRDGKRWRASVEKSRSGHVSLYLRYEKGARPLKVNFKLILLAQDGSSAIARELSHVYERFEDGGYTGWGYHKFCRITDLYEKGAYNQEADSISVRVEFTTHEATQ